MCTALLFTHPWNSYQTISDISEAKVSLGFGQYGHWTDSNHDLLTSFSLKKSFNDVPLNDLLFLIKNLRILAKLHMKPLADDLILALVHSWIK